MLVVTASLREGGFIVCKSVKSTCHRPITSEARDAGGKPYTVTSYVRTTTQAERIFAQDQLEISGTDGKPIDNKELPKRLQKETPAIFLATGRIDPNLLPLLKEGTLVIRLKTPGLAAPPLMPPIPAR